MKIQNYFAQSAFSFVNEIRLMNTQNKKITILAIAAFSLFALCYYIISRRRVSPTHLQNQETPFFYTFSTKEPVESEQNPQNTPWETHFSSNASPKSPILHRIHEDKESNKLLTKVEMPPPFQQAASDTKSKLEVATPLQTQGVEKVTQQKEERKEMIYLFSPYNFGSAEQLLSDTYPGLAEMKTSLEKAYRQVIFTEDPQTVKKGASVLFFLGKSPRIDFHNYNVIQIMERLGNNVLILLFCHDHSYSREEFKDFLKPESVNDGPGKGKIAVDVLEKYRDFDSFLIYEYYTTILNTGVGEPTIVRKFKGNPKPAQEIVKKLKDMEKYTV